MENKSFDNLRERLDELEWPSEYMFKFIVPAQQEKEILALFINEETNSRPSRNGTYISITSTVFSLSPESVIKIHTLASKIEGVIAL